MRLTRILKDVSTFIQEEYVAFHECASLPTGMIEEADDLASLAHMEGLINDLNDLIRIIEEWTEAD